MAFHDKKKVCFTINYFILRPKMNIFDCKIAIEDQKWNTKSPFHAENSYFLLKNWISRPKMYIFSLKWDFYPIIPLACPSCLFQLTVLFELQSYSR